MTSFRIGIHIFYTIYASNPVWSHLFDDEDRVFSTIPVIFVQIRFWVRDPPPAIDEKEVPVAPGREKNPELPGLPLPFHAVLPRGPLVEVPADTDRSCFALVNKRDSDFPVWLGYPPGLDATGKAPGDKEAAHREQERCFYNK